MIYEIVLTGLAGILAGYSFRVARQDARMDYWLQFGGVLVALLLLADGNVLRDIAYQKAYNDAAVLISTRYACTERAIVDAYVTLPSGQRVPLIFNTTQGNGANSSDMPLHANYTPISPERENNPFR